MKFARKYLLKPALAAVVACSALAAQAGDIVDVAAKAGSFKTLIAAAKAADLVPALKGDGPITVFAPTDAAFAKLPKGTVEALLKPENKGKLQTILKFHVVAGKAEVEDVIGRSTLDTLAGQRLDVAFKDGRLSVNGANVVAVNVKADNGVIHVIDSVMLPESKDIVGTAVAAEFKTLVAAVKAAGLVEALQGNGPFTVFAPTDAAFAKLPKGTVESLLKPENKSKLQAILKYHVVPGRVYADVAIKGVTAKTLQGSSVTTSFADGRLQVNSANVVATDIETSNGVIHVIDSVILPPAGTADAMKMIEKAIAVGAPAYNHGNVHKCVNTYKHTLTQLMSHDAVDAATSKMIKTSMNKAAHQCTASKKAWAYRHTLDAVYAKMHSSMSETQMVMDTRPSGQ